MKPLEAWRRLRSAVARAVKTMMVATVMVVSCAGTSTSEVRFAVFTEDFGEIVPAVRSLIVADGDGILHQRYFNGFDGDRPQRVHSVTKSVLSLLIGIARAEGTFPSLDTALGDLYPDLIPPDRLAGYKTVTLRHLLTMTTGQLWQERGRTLWAWAFSFDRRQVMLHLPLVDAPGDVFRYNTGASDLLGHVLADGAGAAIRDYAQARLFGPLGITGAGWLTGGGAYDNTGAGLMLSPRAMVRIGQLVLGRGVWRGDRIVPEDWIDRATTAQIPQNRTFGYGYQFWVRNLAGCVASVAWGRGGQFIVVVPEKDLVIVATSSPAIGGGDVTPYWDLFRRITARKDGSCDRARLYRPDAMVRRVDQEAEFAKLPPDLVPLFTDFVQAFRDGDLDRAMSHYSDRFSSAGATKAARRGMWVRYIEGGGMLAYSVGATHRVAPDLWLFEGTVHGGFGSVSTSTYLVREKGVWRFLGDRDAGLPAPDLPKDLQEFLARHIAAHGSGNADRVMDLVSERYLANGFDRAALRRRYDERPPELALTDVAVKRLMRTADGYALHGDLVFNQIGTVPMHYLYGHVARENGRLVWIGNQRRRGVVGPE